jgi:hypothetical protein
MKDKNYIKNNNINLDKEASFLNKTQKTNPFVVPEDYFDELPGKIQEKIAAKTSAKTVYTGFISNKWQYKILAAFFLVILIIGSVLLIRSPETGTEGYQVDLTLDDIIDENNDVMIDFDETLLMEILFAENNGYSDYSDLESSLDNLDDIPSDDMIDFLIEENNIQDLVYDL